jgi:hypothetical protein
MDKRDAENTQLDKKPHTPLPISSVIHMGTLRDGGIPMGHRDRIVVAEAGSIGGIGKRYALRTHRRPRKAIQVEMDLGLVIYEFYFYTI